MSSTISYTNDDDTSNDSCQQEGENYLKIYDKYRRTYRVKKPQSEKRFIRRFLGKLDYRQANYTQYKLLKAYPDKVLVKQDSFKLGSNGGRQFIALDQLTWPLVAEAIASMTGQEIVTMTMKEPSIPGFTGNKQIS